MWVLQNVGNFKIGKEYETWYTEEKYTEEKYRAEVKSLAEKFNKDDKPLDFAIGMLRIYNGVKDDPKLKKAYLDFLKKKNRLSGIWNSVSRIQPELERNRIKWLVERQIALIPEMNDTYDDKWNVIERGVLSEKFRPERKLNQIKMIIDMGRTWEWYLRKLYEDDDDELRRVQYYITDDIEELEGYYNGTREGWRIDFLKLDVYLNNIFTWRDKIADDDDHLEDRKPYQENIKKELKNWWTSWNVTAENTKYCFTTPKEMERVRIFVLECIREIDEETYRKYYAGEAINQELWNDISEIRIDWEYNAKNFNKEMEAFDAFLKDENKMQEFFELASWVTVKTETYTSVNHDMPVTSTYETYSGQEKVVQFLINNGFGKDVANTVRKKMYERAKAIKEQNAEIKKKTEDSVKAEYTKEKNVVNRQIRTLQKQMKDEGGEKGPNYQEYYNSVVILTKQLESIDGFLSWGKLMELPLDDEGNLTVSEDGTLELREKLDPDTKQTITLASICQAAYDTANQIAFMSAAEKVIGIAILETYPNTIDNIEKKVENGWWTVAERKLALIGDIEWIGTWRSDDTFNTVLDVVQEVIIEVAICVVSMGIGTAISAGVRWLFRLGRYLVKAINASRRVNRLVRISQMTQKTLKVLNRIKNIKFVTKWGNLFKNGLLRIWVPASKVAKMNPMNLAKSFVNMVSEWAWFHLSSTVLHNAINGDPLWKWVNPFGYTIGPNGEMIPNRKWYAQSIAFLAVLKNIGKPIQNLSKTFVTKIMWEKLSATTMGNIMKTTLSVPAEMGSLIVTEQALSLVFDGEFKSMEGKDFITMFGMVIWLRLHGGINKYLKLPSVAGKIDKRTIKKFSTTKNGEWVITVKGADGKEYEIRESEIGRTGGNAKVWNKSAETGLTPEKFNLKKDFKKLKDGDILEIQRWGKSHQLKKVSDGKNDGKFEFISDNGWFVKWEMLDMKLNKDGNLQFTRANGDVKTAIKDNVKIIEGKDELQAKNIKIFDNLPEAKNADFSVGDKVINTNGNKWTVTLINENGITVKYDNGGEMSTGVGNVRITEKVSTDLAANKFKLWDVVKNTNSGKEWTIVEITEKWVKLKYKNGSAEAYNDISNVEMVKSKTFTELPEAVTNDFAIGDKVINSKGKTWTVTLINENGITVKYELGGEVNTKVENVRITEKVNTELAANKFKLWDMLENTKSGERGKAVEITENGVKLRYEGNVEAYNDVVNLKIAEKTKFDIGNEVKYINKQWTEVSGTIIEKTPTGEYPKKWSVMIETKDGTIFSIGKANLETGIAKREKIYSSKKLTLVIGNINSLIGGIKSKMQSLVEKIKTFFSTPERTTVEEKAIVEEIKTQKTNAKTNEEKNIVNETESVFKEWQENLEIIEVVPEQKISFEKTSTLDEVYKELDKVWSIYSKDAKKTYTAKEIKEMIRKWETKYIPSEWGLRSKVESLITFTKPKKIFDSKDINDSFEHIISILKELRNRWQYYDKKFSDFKLDTPSIKYWWTSVWRPIVEVKMPNWNSEYFYKSTWWAWKAWDGAWWTTAGMWQVFWWFADAHIVWYWKVKGRFIKDQSYKDYYWSKTFENIAKSLDDVMIQKMGVNNVFELDTKINFQNKEINTFVPQL